MMRGFAVASCIATALLATAARAEIKCDGDGNQRVQGNWMPTPYCQDKQLYQVANARGFKTSFAEIRNNPNHKKELCRYLFSDIRVQATCLNAGVPEYFGGAGR